MTNSDIADMAERGSLWMALLRGVKMVHERMEPDGDAEFAALLAVLQADDGDG